MTTTTKPSFDGATLSPKLKPKGDLPPDTLTLPIGKASGPGGRQIARAYKHAAGKSSTYSPEVVDMIYHMARNGFLEDAHTLECVEAKLSSERDLPRSAPPLTWDQLVFLSANLTRLVIDPYREKCDSRVRIGAEREQPLELDWPIVLGGVDFTRLPEHAARPIVQAAIDAGIAVESMRDARAKRIATVDVASAEQDFADVAAVEITAERASDLTGAQVRTALERIRSATANRIPIGIAAPAFNAAQVIRDTIELSPDFYVADAQWTADARPTGISPELEAAPALHVLADTVEQLRRLNREAAVNVLYRGGIRGGADAGKALCLGASAVYLGLSAVVGLGYRITSIRDEADLLRQIAKPLSDGDPAHNVFNFAKSVNMEVTMLARACGKSSVANMEPEDLRSLTIAVSAATGVPLTGKDWNFRR